MSSKLLLVAAACLFAATANASFGEEACPPNRGYFISEYDGNCYRFQNQKGKAFNNAKSFDGTSKTSCKPFEVQMTKHEEFMSALKTMNKWIVWTPAKLVEEGEFAGRFVMPDGTFVRSHPLAAGHVQYDDSPKHKNKKCLAFKRSYNKVDHGRFIRVNCKNKCKVVCKVAKCAMDGVQSPYDDTCYRRSSPDIPWAESIQRCADRGEFVVNDFYTYVEAAAIGVGQFFWTNAEPFDVNWGGKTVKVFRYKNPNGGWGKFVRSPNRNGDLKILRRKDDGKNCVEFKASRGALVRQYCNSICPVLCSSKPYNKAAAKTSPDELSQEEIDSYLDGSIPPRGVQPINQNQINDLLAEFGLDPM